jgi:hypothetical protein
MDEKNVSNVPVELAIALVVGGVVFAIVGVAFNVVAGLIAAVVLGGGLFWFLDQ